MKRFCKKACLFVVMGIALNAYAVRMERIEYNNPGLVVDLGLGLWAWPVPMDYDNDGDYDLVVCCPDKPYDGIYLFENTEGNVKMPVFEPPKRLDKAKKNLQISYVDGKERILDTNYEIIDLRKNGVSKAVKIYPTPKIHKTEGKTRANQWKYCDYDDDGDLDIVAGIEDWTDYGWDNAYDENGKWLNGPLHGYIYLLTNNGTTDKPDYAEPVKIQAGGEPIDLYGMPSQSLADFDGDGDLDMICGEFIDKFTYFENIGSRQKPEYAKGRYLMYSGKVITMYLCMFTPVAIDWDKDGDWDIVTGEEDGTVSLLENTGRIVDGMPEFIPPVKFQQKADRVKYGALVTPYSFDWDGDGDEDIICGNTAGNIGFIENLGMQDGKPKWAKPVDLTVDGKVIRIMAGDNGSIQGPCETKWGYTVLNVADWDNDGLADIVVNSISGEIIWFKNVGEKGNPRLAAAKPVEVQWDGVVPTPAWNWRKAKDKELIVQWRTTPLVTDHNADGLNDLILVDAEGYLAFFERFKEDGVLKLHPGKRIFYGQNGAIFDAKGTPRNDLLQLNNGEAGRSGRRKFCLADWDRDGRNDLLVNSLSINFLRNITEQDGQYLFADNGAVAENILAGHTTCPTTVDWDKNGVPDLLVGAEDGHFYYLENPFAAR